MCLFQLRNSLPTFREFRSKLRPIKPADANLACQLPALEACNVTQIKSPIWTHHDELGVSADRKCRQSH